MKGFFSVKETQSSSRPDGKIYSCVSCGLYKNSINPKMKPQGNFAKQILIIGGFPSDLEDKKNKLWQNIPGRFLSESLQKIGIDLHEDCLFINAVNCIPLTKDDNYRSPNNYEMDCCKTIIVSKVIKEYQPKLILLLGKDALYSFLSNHWSGSIDGLAKWRGFVIPDKKHKCWVLPTYDPKIIYDAYPEVLTVWQQDINKIEKYVDKPLPKYKEPVIDVITDLSVLSKITTGPVAIDYETTGLKPHAKGHRIVCVSVATTDSHVYVFMLPDNRKDRQPFIDLLKNPEISKMGHNIKYEENWSVQRLRQPVEGWEWDSMLAAHILDNRPGITGLKFQTYIHFGVTGYENEVSQYLKSEDKDGNAMNRVLEFVGTTSGRDELLKYCALDSIYQYRLAMLQQKIMNFLGMPF